MSLILFDTHAALWFAAGKMSPRVALTLDAAATRDELLLSPISAWEIGLLVKRGRLRLAVPWRDFVRSIFTQRGVLTAALTPDIAAESTELSSEAGDDPADRIIIATAAAYRARLLTRDARIQEFAKKSGLIDCIAC